MHSRAMVNSPPAVPACRQVHPGTAIPLAVIGKSYQLLPRTAGRETIRTGGIGLK